MRIRRFLAVLMIGAAGASSLAACNSAILSGGPVLPTVVNVRQESATPMAQALARFGYQPIRPIYGTKGAVKDTQVGTLFLICDGKYKDSYSQCSDDYRKVATDRHPAVWVEGEKVVHLIGAHSTSFGSTTNFVVNVPTTWQDFVRLTPDQQATLVNNVVPTASKLCCGDMARAIVSVDGPGQVMAGWDEV